MLSFRHPWKDQSDSVYNHSAFVMGWLRVSHIRNAKKRSSLCWRLLRISNKSMWGFGSSRNFAILLLPVSHGERVSPHIYVQPSAALCIGLINYIDPKIKLDIKEEASTGVWQKRDFQWHSARSLIQITYENPDWWFLFLFLCQLKLLWVNFQFCSQSVVDGLSVEDKTSEISTVWHTKLIHKIIIHLRRYIWVIKKL